MDDVKVWLGSKVYSRAMSPRSKASFPYFKDLFEYCAQSHMTCDNIMPFTLNFLQFAFEIVWFISNFKDYKGHIIAILN